MATQIRTAGRGGRWAAFVVLAGALAVLPGCQIFGFVAAGLEEREALRERDIMPEYTGLEGKTFAVVVAADRSIQADHPGVMDELTMRITALLEENSGASGRVPAPSALRYLYDNPKWVAMPRGELAKKLGVDRLIVVDLLQYQLNEPGNQYIWSGVAAGSVGVVEADSPLADEFVFQKQVRITFPDKEGFGPGDFTRNAVSSVLIQRFTNRAAWLFYTHKETGRMDY